MLFKVCLSGLWCKYDSMERKQLMDVFEIRLYCEVSNREEIMRDNRTKCILMWRWIVDHPGASKEDWCDAHPNLALEIEDHNNCYACKENDEIRGNDYNCTDCPVWWGNEYQECLDTGSPYNDWEVNLSHRVEDAIRVLHVIEDTWSVS